MKHTVVLVSADGGRARVDPGSPAEADFVGMGYLAEAAAAPEAPAVEEEADAGEGGEDEPQRPRRGRPRTRF